MLTTSNALRLLVEHPQNSARRNHDRHASSALYCFRSDNHRRSQSANRLELTKVSEITDEPDADAFEDACPVIERHRDELALPGIKVTGGQFSAAKNDLAGQGQRDCAVLADSIGDLDLREFRHHVDRCRLMSMTASVSPADRFPDHLPWLRRYQSSTARASSDTSTNCSPPPSTTARPPIRSASKVWWSADVCHAVC